MTLLRSMLKLEAFVLTLAFAEGRAIRAGLFHAGLLSIVVSSLGEDVSVDLVAAGDIYTMAHTSWIQAWGSLLTACTFKRCRRVL